MLIVLASALAVAAVPLWLLVGWNETAASRAFVSTPEFTLWVLVLCVQAAIWVAAAVFVVGTLRRRVRDLRRRHALPAAAVAAIIAALIALALVVALFILGPRLAIFDGLDEQLEAASPVPVEDEWPLPSHETKMRPLVGTGLFLGLLAVAGMWLTSVAFRDVAERAGPRVFWIRRFVVLRGELTTLLAVAGALIALGTLASGTLRGAVLALNRAPDRGGAVTCVLRELGRDETADVPQSFQGRLDDLLVMYPDCRELEFAPEYVVAYGLMFSVVLGIAFAPSFAAMRSAGARLRDCTYRLPPPGDPTFFDVVERRRAFDDLLQTNLSATTTYKAAAAVLAPLAASIVSTFVTG